MATVVSSIRLQSDQKARSERAARKLGITYNEFITSAATQRAEEVSPEPDEPEANFVDGILAIANDLRLRSENLTAGDSIKNPFGAARDRHAGKAT